MTKNNTTTSFPPSKAFRRGLGLLCQKDTQEARTKIMTILGVTSRPSFLAYADGERPLDVDKARSIEELFASYGVAAPWGKE